MTAHKTRKTNQDELRDQLAAAAAAAGMSPAAYAKTLIPQQYAKTVTFRPTMSTRLLIDEIAAERAAGGKKFTAGHLVRDWVEERAAQESKKRSGKGK